LKRFSAVTLALSLSLIFSADNFFAGPRERVLSWDQPLPIKVEQYGRISFAKEKVYLDQLALSLRRQPEVTSHIVIYGRNEHDDKVRANRVKNYFEPEASSKSIPRHNRTAIFRAYFGTETLACSARCG
jgi:hypothetical protein